MMYDDVIFSLKFPSPEYDLFFFPFHFNLLLFTVVTITSLLFMYLSLSKQILAVEMFLLEKRTLVIKLQKKIQHSHYHLLRS